MTLLLVVLPVLILALALFVGRKRNIYQAAVRFGAVLLSTLTGLLTVSLLRPTVLSICNTVVSGMLPENVSTYIHESTLFRDLLSVVSSIAMPLLFVVAFLVFFLIFGVAAVIVSSKVLSDEALAQRKAAKQTETDGEQPSAPSDAVKNINWKPIVLRIASLVITAVSVLGILSMLASPLTVYAELIDENNEMLHTLIGESADTEAIESLFDIASGINSHPVSRIYNAFNGLATRSYATRKTTSGTTVNSFDAISSLLHVAESVITIDFEKMSGDDISKLATKLGGNTFVREFADNLLSNASEAWIGGYTFLGIEAPVIVDKETTDSLLSVLQTNSGVSVLQTLGNTMSVVETIIGANKSDDDTDNGNAGGHNQNDKKPLNTADLNTNLYTLLANVDSTSVVLMEKVVTTSFANTVVEQFPMEVDIIATVVKIASGVSESTDLTEKKKEELIEDASSSLANIIEMAQNPEQTDTKKIVNTIVRSEMLVEALVIETDGGAKKNVLGVAQFLPENTKKEVDIALKEAGYDVGSTEYKAIMAAISSNKKK